MVLCVCVCVCVFLGGGEGAGCVCLWGCSVFRKALLELLAFGT